MLRPIRPFKPALLRNPYGWSVLLFTVVLIASWSFVAAFSDYGENEERQALLAMTSAAAASFDAANVSNLKGSADDLNTPEYAQVRASLKRIHAAVENARFAYLMALRNDNVVFLADAEEPNSPDYSPPGQVYTEATPLLRGIFVNRTAATEGPMTDRWGRWVSGLTPLLILAPEMWLPSWASMSAPTIGRPELPAFIGSASLSAGPWRRSSRCSPSLHFASVVSARNWPSPVALSRTARQSSTASPANLRCR